MPAPALPMQPQAALEQATVNALRAPDPQGLGLRDEVCKRTFDGMPPASCGLTFVAVWSDGSRRSESRTCLNEANWGVNVTITRLIDQPRDRLVVIRDEIETLANRIRALVHKDSWNHFITNAANVLCQFDPDVNDQFASTRPVGFREPLRFLNLDPIQEQGPDWFSAEPSSSRFGLSQTLRFGEARMVQATYTTPTR